MRIGLLLPVADQPTSRAYALWTQAASALGEALGQQRVDVHATPLVDKAPDGPSYLAGPRGAEMTLRLAHCFENARELDLIHSLVGFSALPYSSLVGTPVLATVWKDMVQGAPGAFEQFDQRVYYIAAAQADQSPDLHYSATVPWGIALQRIAFQATAGSYLVYAGELTEASGVLEAIEVAERAGRPLVLVAGVQDPVFFRTQIEPRLDAQKLRHEPDPAGPQADQLIGQALGLLHTSGIGGLQRLTVLDAMARGTPVVALGGDRVPESVREGISGVRCSNVEAAVAAVGRLEQWDRAACRQLIERDYPFETTVEQTLKAYEKIVAQARRMDHRPWGYYEVLSDEPTHKVKRLVVYPGKRLSLQRHSQRAEHWFLVDGEAMVVRDDEEIRVLPGQSVEIPRGCWHRIRNPGAQNLTLIEVQTGDYFGEDDIERKEDDFGRT